MEFLIPLLTDPHHDVRAHAAWALGKIGDARAIEPLKRLLQDPKEDVAYGGRNRACIVRGEKKSMTPPLLKPSEEVQIDLKNHLQEMDLEITKEFASDDLSGFWTKSGDFPLLIENQKPLKYYVVAFQITFSDEAIIKALNEYYDKQDHRFIFRLIRVLTSPLTSFVRVIEGGRVTGFTIMKSIYPFHEEFSIRDLDRAIQAVVSTGAVGISFLKSEMGQMVLDHTPPSPKSTRGDV